MVEKWYVLMLYHEEIGLDCMCSNNLDYFKIHIWFTAKRTKLKGYQKGTIHTTQTTLGTRHRRRTKKNRTQNFSLFHDSWLSWRHHFESVTLATMTWLTAMEYLCHKWPRICSTYHKHFLFSFMTYDGFVTRLPRRVPLVEQELLTLPEHLSSATVLSGFRVTRSLILCVCFVDRCLSFCPFSFGHYAVCSSFYRFWYLQTLFIKYLPFRGTRVLSQYFRWLRAVQYLFFRIVLCQLCLLSFFVWSFNDLPGMVTNPCSIF